MNYTPIKKAMLAIGHVVSDGEQWLASDIAAFRDFAHFTLGVAHDECQAILQYPDHFASHWARIHEMAGMPAAAAAPIEPPAPVLEETPVAIPQPEPEPVHVEPVHEEPAPVLIPEPVAEHEEPAHEEPAQEPVQEAPAAEPTLTFNVFGGDKE